MLKRVGILIILFLMLSMNIVSSEESSSQELKSFCKRYGFRLKFKKGKQVITLVKGGTSVRFLLNSTVALTNKNEVWFLKKRVQINNGRIILPSTLVSRLKNIQGNNTDKDRRIAQNQQDNSTFLDDPAEKSEPVKENRYSEREHHSSDTNKSNSQQFREPLQESRYVSSNEKISFIILDAGHGGKDPGNNHNNLPEKNVTLTMTQKVYRILKKKAPHIKIYLTRSDDRYLSLEERSEKAVRLTHLKVTVSL